MKLCCKTLQTLLDYFTVNALKTFMKSKMPTRLISFLQSELEIPDSSIATALRHPEAHPSLLPMILWQYGLVTLEQLDQIFDWLEMA